MSHYPMMTSTILWGGTHDGREFPIPPTWRDRVEVIRPKRLDYTIDVYIPKLFYCAVRPGVIVLWKCYVHSKLIDWYEEAIPRQMTALLGLIEGWRWV